MKRVVASIPEEDKIHLEDTMNKLIRIQDSVDDLLTAILEFLRQGHDVPAWNVSEKSMKAIYDCLDKLYNRSADKTNAGLLARLYAYIDYAIYDMENAFEK